MKSNRVFIFIATTVTIISMSLSTTDACSSQSESTTARLTTTTKSLFCNNSTNCLDNEICLNHMCSEACDVARSIATKDALCTAHDHTAYWECPKGYAGSPFFKCIRPCSTNVNCPKTDKCVCKMCIPRCEFILDKTKEYCATMRHKPLCHWKINYL